MNYSIIIYIIGMILEIEAVFMALPAITALIYQETSGVAFLITIALCLVIGLPLTRKKPTRKAFYTKEGFVTVALSWIVLTVNCQNSVFYLFRNDSDPDPASSGRWYAAV